MYTARRCSTRILPSIRLWRIFSATPLGQTRSRLSNIWEALAHVSPVEYFSGKMSADPARGSMYNPAVAKTLRTVPGMGGCVPHCRIQAHLGQEMRAMDVSWRLLLERADLVSGFAFAAANAADGENASMEIQCTARRVFPAARSAYIERYYDHFLFWISWEEIFKIAPDQKPTESPA